MYFKFQTMWIPILLSAPSLLSTILKFFAQSLVAMHINCDSIVVAGVHLSWQVPLENKYLRTWVVGWLAFVSFNLSYKSSLGQSSEAIPSRLTVWDASKYPVWKPTNSSVEVWSSSITLIAADGAASLSKCCAMRRPLVQAPAMDGSTNQSPHTPTWYLGS